MLNFGMLLMPTMYRSHSNFEMTNGCLWGSMNLHMNQCWADMAARQNLYNVPIMNFGNFSPYGVFSSMNYLLDPGFAAAQWMGAQMLNSASIFPNPNMGGGINLPGTSNNDSTLTAEEKKAKEQYNKLNLLLKAYCEKSSRTGTALKEEMQEALKGKTTWVEKLDVLKDIYKKADKEELEKVLATLESTNPKVNYRTALKNIGYKFENSDCNDKFIEDVKELKDDNDIDEIIETVDKYVKAKDKDNHILNFISTWNDIDAGTNLIDYAISQIEKVDDEIIGNELAKTLVDALVKKGKDVATDPALSSESKAEISNYITVLKEQLTDVSSDDDSIRNLAKCSFKEAFNDLYAALRIAETKIIQKQMKKDYEFTADIATNDTDFIKDDNLIIEETIKDLTENEELDAIRTEDIKTNKIKLTA